MYVRIEERNNTSGTNVSEQADVQEQAERKKKAGCRSRFRAVNQGACFHRQVMHRHVSVWPKGTHANSLNRLLSVGGADIVVTCAYGNLVHAKILATIGSSRLNSSIGHDTRIDSRSSTVGSVGVEIVYHLRVELFSSLGLRATCVTTTTAGAPTLASTTRRSSVRGRFAGSCRFWLSFRLTWTTLDTPSMLSHCEGHIRNSLTESLHGSWRGSSRCIDNHLNLVQVRHVWTASYRCRRHLHRSLINEKAI